MLRTTLLQAQRQSKKLCQVLRCIRSWPLIRTSRTTGPRPHPHPRPHLFVNGHSRPAPASACAQSEIENLLLSRSKKLICYSLPAKNYTVNSQSRGPFLTHFEILEPPPPRFPPSRAVLLTDSSWFSEPYDRRSIRRQLSSWILRPQAS